MSTSCDVVVDAFIRLADNSVDILVQLGLLLRTLKVTRSTLSSPGQDMDAEKARPLLSFLMSMKPSCGGPRFHQMHILSAGSNCFSCEKMILLQKSKDRSSY